MVCLLPTPKSVRSVKLLLRVLYEPQVCAILRLHVSQTLKIEKDGCDFKGIQSGHSSGTIRDISKQIQEHSGIEPGYYTIPKCRGNLLKYMPKPEDLPTRSMKDSFTTALLPLSEASERDHYVNHLRMVRMGRLMEALDLFAVWICHRHVDAPSLPPGIPMPYIFVTVLVESAYFASEPGISASEDIDVCGHVSWTGLNSMEVTIFMRQKKRKVCRAIFVMAARNATNTGPAVVNQLQPANEEEKLCLEQSIKRQSTRQEKRSNAVLNSRPTKEDEQLMFDIFTRTQGTDPQRMYKLTLPPNCKWMSNSFKTTTLRCFPDNRNVQNEIFGGFVVRSAIEISSIAASIHAGGQPWIEGLLDVAFYRPVKVNSFLEFTAYIVYTFEKYIHLLCIVQVMDINSQKPVTANSLHLVYKSDHEVEEVLPSTYQEALCYINGRNKFRTFLDMKKELSPKPSNVETEPSKSSEETCN